MEEIENWDGINFDLLGENAESDFWGELGLSNNQLDLSTIDISPLSDITETQNNMRNENPLPDQDDQSILLPLNCTSKQPSFVKYSDQDKEDFIEKMKNPNTTRKTEHCSRQFHRWLNETADFRMAWDIPPTELDNLIGSFLLSIRKADGGEYEPDTLTSYHRGIDRTLREHDYPKSIITDKEFATSRAVLASKRKELKGKGKGNRPYAAEPLTNDDETLLWEKECIGTKSPQQLLNTMWLNNTMLFGLRGGTENHKLRWGDVQLKTDTTGREYLEYNERITKTRTGEQTSSDQRAFKPKQFAHRNPEKCPVQAYKEYVRHRPKIMCEPESPFYLSINYQRRPGSDAWYKSQAMGENSIRSMMKKMANKAGLTGRKTNHSARKTTCTKLLHAGVAPNTIQQLTGHRNVQSINNYATASNDMQKQMSNILTSNATAIHQALGNTEQEKALSVPRSPHSNTVTHSYMNQQHSVLSTMSTETRTASGHIMQNAHLVNCHIYINNNNSYSSPPKRKRIRIIESSDSE